MEAGGKEQLKVVPSCARVGVRFEDLSEGDRIKRVRVLAERAVRVSEGGREGGSEGGMEGASKGGSELIFANNMHHYLLSLFLSLPTYQSKKIFRCIGGYKTICKCLRERGWVEQEHTKPPPSSHPSESPTKAHSPRRVHPRECHRQTSCDGVTDSSSDDDDDDDDADLVDRRSEEEYSDEEEYCMLVRGGEREEGEMGGVEREKGGRDGRRGWKRKEERGRKSGREREQKNYNNLYFFLLPSPVQFATVLPTLCGHCVVMTFSTATCTRMPLQTTLLRHPPSPPRYVHTPLE